MDSSLTSYKKKNEKFLCCFCLFFLHSAVFCFQKDKFLLLFNLNTSFTTLQTIWLSCASSRRKIIVFSSLLLSFKTNFKWRVAVNGILVDYSSLLFNCFNILLSFLHFGNRFFKNHWLSFSTKIFIKRCCFCCCSMNQWPSLQSEPKKFRNSN